MRNLRLNYFTVTSFPFPIELSDLKQCVTSGMVSVNRSSKNVFRQRGKPYHDE